MDKKKKIVMVLPRGETIPVFIYSGVAAHLREHCHLVIISIIPDAETELLLRETCDEFHQLKYFRPSGFIRFFWDWIDVVHGKWLWTGAAQRRWERRGKESNSISKKIKWRLRRIFVPLFTNQIGLEILEYLESVFARFLKPYNEYVRLLKSIEPDLVFNSSHIHSELAKPIICAAQNLGYKTATFIFSWDNLSSQGRLSPYYDFYLVWNMKMKEDLLRIYPKIKPDTVHSTGTPQFYFYFRNELILAKEKFAKMIGVDPLRPFILYTTSMEHLTPDEDIIVERIADICQEISSKPQLVVRVYPKDISGRFDKLKDRRKDIFFPATKWVQKYFLAKPEDIEMYSNLLYHCDLGINVASTVSIELYIFNKPVINIAYNPKGLDSGKANYADYYQWEHYKPITESGAVDIVYKEEDLGKAIWNSLEFPDSKALLRKKLIVDFFGIFPETQSAIKVAEKLLELSS